MMWPPRTARVGQAETDRESILVRADTPHASARAVRQAWWILWSRLNILILINFIWKISLKFDDALHQRATRPHIGVTYSTIIDDIRNNPSLRASAYNRPQQTPQRQIRYLFSR
jgi:hypothetical protein